MEMGNRQFIFQLKTFDLKAESDKRCSHIPGNKDLEVFNRNPDCRYFFILTPDISKILLSSDIFTLDSESKFIPNSLSFSQEHIYNVRKLLYRKMQNLNYICIFGIFMIRK